jgi:hypothetical protein
VFKIETGFGINKISGGDSLRIIDVDRTGQSQAFIIFIDQMTGAVLGAQAASRTFVSNDIPGPQPQVYRKITGLSLDGK